MVARSSYRFLDLSARQLPQRKSGGQLLLHEICADAIAQGSTFERLVDLVVLLSVKRSCSPEVDMLRYDEATGGRPLVFITAEIQVLRGSEVSHETKVEDQLWLQPEPRAAAMSCRRPQPVGPALPDRASE